MNAATALARRLISALVRVGVTDVVACPGSRDAPLLYALNDAANAGALRVHVRLDERSAAYVALGLGKASQLTGMPRPAVVVTTSGTAVANLHPAVLEADAAATPLLIVSANRPAELWHTGANQTTIQPGIFATAPRFQTQLPPDFPPDHRLDGLVARAVAAATGRFTRDPGPVHLDVSFRDPLVPDDLATPSRWADHLRLDAVSPASATEAHPTPLELPARTVVVAGDAAGPDAAFAAQQAGWPLFAEPSSGARFGLNAITDYQGALADTSLSTDIDAVLVYGHPTLSRPITALLAGPAPVFVATRTPRWSDLAGVARVLASPITATATGHDPSWLNRWHDADRRAQATRPVRPKDAVAAAVWRAHAAPGAPALVLGASDVIRAFDRHARPTDCEPIVVANRGLAGIDGTISTALGVTAGIGRPARVVVGDLTAIHDFTALIRGNLESDANLQIMVLNDHGGAIFSGLEHAAAPQPTLERFFLTPQRVDFAHLAAAAGIGYVRAEVGQLAEVLSRPITGTSLVEVVLVDAAPTGEPR